MSEVDMRARELEDFEKPSGPMLQCQFVPE